MPGVLFLEWGIHFSPNKNYFQVIVLRGRYYLTIRLVIYH